MYMRKELTQKLFSDYPKLYVDKDKPDHVSLMCYGFECGDGWFNLINELSRSLEKLIEERNLNLRAFQVKQKFGRLRFYTEHENASKDDTADIYAAIRGAEDMSYKTCEMCGKPGVIRNDRSWATVLCDEHNK